MKVIPALPIAAILACMSVPAAAVAADAPSKPAAKSAQAKQIERGRYLVAIMGCNDCHTQDFHARGDFKIPEKDRLTGSTVGWRGPWGTTYPANLRQYFQLATESAWVAVAKEVQRRPPMHNFSLNAMTGSDVRAMYHYLRHLGPAGAPAPSALPPGKEPPKPYVQFPE
jgi:hypothetical protein